MSASWANPFRRWVAIALALAAAGWLSYAGLKHEWAAHDGASANPDDWLRAAAIEPTNAENWYRLGRYRQLDFDHADLPLAISYYKRAVQIDPRSAFYKLDLATALEMSGDDAGAEKYFREAQENYPLSAEVSWRYGNFLLRRQRLPEANAEIHRALAVDPKLIPLAVSRVWHANPDVDMLLGQVLPDTEAADWEALSFLVQSQEGPASLAVWKRLVSKKPTMDRGKAFAFIDMLIDQDRYDDAGRVWSQFEAAEAGSVPAPEGGSLVFDGGFERDLSGGGFGWRQKDVAGADFDFDTEEKHSGARSARIIFDGSQNVNYQSLYQFVLVVPNMHYRFQGFLRTDQISTDSGIRFEIYDPKHRKDLELLTPNETGTQPWTLEEAKFKTGPETHIVGIGLYRGPSARLDNKLSGTVWVDDVALFPVGPGS